jgi:hypothetical protein
MICYENRNGLVHAYDTESRLFVNPRGEDFRIMDETVLEEYTPEEIAEELTKRGVREVLVWTKPGHGLGPPWVSGEIRRNVDRLRNFAWMASQARRMTKVWTTVPVSRIGDGSDWSDIYRN